MAGWIRALGNIGAAGRVFDVRACTTHAPDRVGPPGCCVVCVEGARIVVADLANKAPGPGPNSPASHGALGWAVRKALIGVALLSMFILAEAWLLHAGVDPDEEKAALKSIADGNE